ncbi:hypothetical protein Pfo_020550 [Paulownia fortunei]|nr:hypothetical protein Pfo_020550 [Paulownia fortunei]
MKNSPSTTATATASSCWISVTIVIVLMAAANTVCSSVTLQETIITNPQKLLYHKPQLGDYHSFSPSPPRPLLQPQRHHPPPQPPPPPPCREGDNEIDPRYGVEKRLVPSGPNPLHN